MTLYFDTKVQFLDADAISTIGKWHPIEPIFAVASYSQEHGGSVTIFDDSGESLKNITFPVHPTSQATALCWHPERQLLVSGWENGEVHAWFLGNREFLSINGPHKSPIVFLEFSEKGGRMVTSDAMGVLTGWRCDNQSTQFLTMFTHDLHDLVLHITFRRTVQSVVTTELNNLARAAVAGDEQALDTLTNWRPRTAARNFSHSGVNDNHCFYVGTQSGIIYYLNQSGTCTEVFRSESAPIIQVLWHPKREAIVTLMEDLTVGHFMVESTGALTELDRVKLSGRIPGQNGAISWAGGIGSLAIITGDFTIRIWDIDSSDNFLLPMELPNRISNSITNTNSNAINTTTTTTASTSANTMEVFTCISYCTDNQTLCAGTNQGNLYTWKRIINNSIDVPENTWQLNNISSVRGTIKHCTWGVCDIIKPCIMVNCISNVFILKEQPLCSSHCRNIWAVQKNANQMYIKYLPSDRSTILTSDISIIDLVTNERNLVITNGRKIMIYKINKDDIDSGDIALTNNGNHKNGTTTTKNGGGGDGKNNNINSIDVKKQLSIKLVNTINGIDCNRLFIYDECVIAVVGQGFKMFSIVGGVVLREFNFTESEGKPIGANLTNQYFVIFSINGYFKIYDISKHEPKPLINQSKSGYDLFQNFGEIIMMKCNAIGTQIAAIIANENLIPDGKLYIWDFERDHLCAKDFLGKHMDREHLNEFISRLPISMYWDTDDNRLIVCETRCIQQQLQLNQQKLLSKSPAHSLSSNQYNNKNNSISTNSGTFIVPMNTDNSGGDLGGNIIGSGGGGLINNFAESQAIIMFVTDKCEIKELEIVNLMAGEQLVNLCAPHVVTLKIGTIEHTPLRDFKGLEASDETTRKMVLDFSLFVAEGNMDQAFRCIRSIQSEAVWNNLAKMCVQTGRLDVAKVCLGHLKKARSVRALRKALEDQTLEDDARTAVLAIELGMIDEAELLYKKCGRYDLLNRLLQACGRFDEALQIAEQMDRIHLKNTYYKYAEWLKEKGDIDGAIKYFDKSNNPTHNVTQMLMENPTQLRQYMQNATDPNLLKWWGQYIESTGDMESAFKIYQKADDTFSQVRVLCYLGQLSKADSIARRSDDKSACYHLARHYENIGKVNDAIQFFTKAQTYTNAVRICKENDLLDELWNVANSGRSRDKASAAAYFEESGDYKRAVELYHRSGMLHKAVEMAFASQQPETLQVIASELDANSDPELVQKCAEFFIGIAQTQKAVNLLANAKQFEKALTICDDYKVPITESLAELLTPTKDEMTDVSVRNKILIQLGDVLQEQGDYHTATKKFTQAGDKMRAMKSLLKSGDTDKIIFFAGMSRQKEIYIMAANYLQALNWQKDSKILKNIITFYTKGQSYDLLANFYASCAEIEIVDFHNYEKALKALQEAARCLTKLTNAQRAIDNLQMTIVDVRKILELQDAMERGDNQIVILGCKNILAQSNVRPPIKIVDIQVLYIEALIDIAQYSEALNVLKQVALANSDWSAQGLLERKLIEKLANECNIDFDSIWQSGQKKQYNKMNIHDQLNNGDENDNDDEDVVNVDEEIEEE